MKQKSNSLVKNRRAYHDYEILKDYEAGIVLLGTEIKSLRNHGGNLQEAYVKIFHSEVWLIGAHIAPYSHGNLNNHDETRDRKLLLHKGEIQKLKKAVQEKSMTIIPLAIYLIKGRAKIKIGIAKGKTKSDKRLALKERDEQRHIQKIMKNYS